MKHLGLYIHIPYCQSKCNYCDFFSIRPDDENSISGYVMTLCKNIRSWKSELNNYVIDTIYIGGGTPSLLSTSDIILLLECIYSNYNIIENPEITLECNPNSITNLELKELKRIGLNRISMGLQSTNDEELKLLGRLHTCDDAKTAVCKIKEAGINNFSLDVMLGIPLQNVASLKKTLEFCIKSDATHISTYMLKIEEDTPFSKNTEKLTFADSDTVADLYELTCQILKSNGFRHYEISNFCKDNLISKHNMKYWNLDEYLGLGPSAHSLINNKRFYYPRNFESFKNNECVFESKGNTAEEYIMLSLRTDQGFDISKFKNKYASDINNSFTQKCELYKKAGLLKVESNNVILTEKGYLVSNIIINDLIETSL